MLLYYQDVRTQMKNRKTYRLDAETFKKLNSGCVHKDITNNTCRAIVKTMIALDRDATGQEILEEAVRSGRWQTAQAREKYMTTWAYYLKKLKTHAGVRCVGELSDNQIDAESFLE